MYPIVELLPPNVRSALPSEKDQKKWMEAFNKAYKENKNATKATKGAWELMKSSPNCRHFEGWLSTGHVDIQGDMMEQEKLFNRLQKHVERGGTMVDVHSNRIVGSLYDVELKKYDDKTIGNYGRSVMFQGEPYFDKMWSEIQSGLKKGFSIGGFATKWEDECNSLSCHRKVTDSSIHEVSICSNPADPYAQMTQFNSLAKSSDKITIDSDHLKKDKEKFIRMRAMLNELLADDEDVTPTGESKEPHGKAFQDAELEACGCINNTLKKVGTRVGICRGHMQSGHKMTNICQGVGFDTSTDRASLDPDESGMIIDWIPDKKAHFEHQIYVDEQKKAKEQMDINMGTILQNNEIKIANNKASEEYAKFFEQATDKMELDERVKGAFEKAIEILELPSGLPVSVRLDLIDKMGCPKCKMITGNIRKDAESKQPPAPQPVQGGVPNAVPVTE